jgi:hypothetical protein
VLAHYGNRVLVRVVVDVELPLLLLGRRIRFAIDERLRVRQPSLEE